MDTARHLAVQRAAGDRNVRSSGAVFTLSSHLRPESGGSDHSRSSSVQALQFSIDSGACQVHEAPGSSAVRRSKPPLLAAMAQPSTISGAGASRKAFVLSRSKRMKEGWRCWGRGATAKVAAPRNASARRAGPLKSGAGRAEFDSRRSWSGKRDLNPRLRPWQGRALPLSYSREEPHFCCPSSGAHCIDATLPVNLCVASFGAHVHIGRRRLPGLDRQGDGFGHGVLDQREGVLARRQICLGRSQPKILSFL